MIYCENIVDIPFLFQKIIFYLHGSKKKLKIVEKIFSQYRKYF